MKTVIRYIAIKVAILLLLFIFSILLHSFTSFTSMGEGDIFFIIDLFTYLENMSTF